MIGSAFMLLIGNLFLSLRLGGGIQGTFPKPLSAQEEKKYVDAWLQNGDIEARNSLIEHNLRLVAHIVKKYYTSASDQDDLISIGTIGLIKGVSTYKSDKNVRLSTYCSRCIENEILMYFRGMKKRAGDVSLSETIDSDGDGNSLSVMDVVAQDDDMLERISLAEARDNVRKCTQLYLDEREREIIEKRYGLTGAKPMTQREVAEVCGISRSYVSRIEKKALEKLRLAME